MVARWDAGSWSSAPRAARPGPRTTAAAASIGRPSRAPARRRHPTTGSSIGSTTCSTAPGSPTTRSSTSGWSTSRPARPSRLTDGRAADGEPAWSPDGTRIAFTSNRRRDADLLTSRPDIHVVDVETRAVTAVTRGPRSMFVAPTWLPDGRPIAALGNRIEGGAGSRNDIWLFAADGSDATPTGGRNLSAAHDLMPGSGMNSDVTRGEGPRLIRLEGRPLARLQRPDRRRLRAVADRRRRRPARAAHRGSPLHLGLGRGPARVGGSRCGSPTCARRRPSRPTCGCSRSGGRVAVEAAPPDQLQRRGPRRARAARAASSAT